MQAIGRDFGSDWVCCVSVCGLVYGMQMIWADSRTNIVEHIFSIRNYSNEIIRLFRSDDISRWRLNNRLSPCKKKQIPRFVIQCENNKHTSTQLLATLFEILFLVRFVSIVFGTTTNLLQSISFIFFLFFCCVDSRYSTHLIATPKLRCKSKTFNINFHLFGE